MKTIAGIVLLLFSTALQAQRTCHTGEYTSLLVQNDPAVAQSILAAELQIQHTINRDRHIARRDTVANELIQIPVVVHIVYNTAGQNISDEQVLSQLTALNNDFSNSNGDKVNRPLVFDNVAADARIRFCLARVAPDGKGTSGIIRRQTNMAVFTADDAVKNSMRGGDDAWDAKKYLNIWVCNLGERMLGYASLPGGPANADGVVIGFDVFGTVGNLRPRFNKGRTLTHEVGHWLGVKHIWGDTECGNDDVDDTPRQLSYHFGCPSFPVVTACSENADGDMFMNFMDFSDDACMNMFTIGQKKRMRALFATGNLRNSFLHSFACDSSLVQAGPVAGDTVPVVQPVKQDKFRFYPNPVSSFITVDYKPALDFVSKPFSIYSMMGIKVAGGQLTKEKTMINLAHLLPGVYIIRIGEGSERAGIKICKQ